MFGLFARVPEKPLKGYKITTVDRKQKYGIAANSLKMLIDKAAAKLKMAKCLVYLAKDGTEVQDEAYFETIEPQTLFVIAEPDTEIKTDFQIMYDTIRNVHGNMFETADAIRNFVAENRTEFDKFFVEYQTTAKELNDNIRASNRHEHAEWFEGVPANITTKEEVMARRSQDRIRGYFYKTKEELQKSKIYRSNAQCRDMIDDILDIFHHFLIGVDYFSSLFNRKWENRHQKVPEIKSDDDTDGTRAPPRKKAKIAAIRDVFEKTNIKSEYYVSLCNELGDFRCHGLWNMDECSYQNHLINPYASRENVILFQMWNLDHQIEITRSVIPKILTDVEQIVIDQAQCPVHKRTAKMVSIMKYFLELFTVENLRLVHIVCHDKAIHDRKSNGRILCDKCKEFKTLENILKKIKKSQL